MAIIERDLWEKVQARKAGNKRPETYRRSRHLISGIMQCEECGGPYIMSGPKHMRCSHHRERGTCDNSLSIRKDDVETRIMEALHTFLLNPKWIQVFIEEYRAEWERLAGDRAGERQKLEKVLARTDAAIAGLVRTLEGGVISDAITDKLRDRESEAYALKAQIAALPEHKVLPVPQNLVREWRGMLDNIRKHLNAGDIVPASEELKGIVERVIVTPGPDKTYDLMITGFVSSNNGCGGRI